MVLARTESELARAYNSAHAASLRQEIGEVEGQIEWLESEAAEVELEDAAAEHAMNLWAEHPGVSAAESLEGDAITDAEDCALVDDDGYPTEWGIAQVRDFHGSPSQLVDLLEQLWWTPTLMTVE